MSSAHSFLSSPSPSLASARKTLRLVKPLSPAQLDGYCRALLGLRIPPLPLAYLTHAFFEDPASPAPRDSIVWANRGGGKTLLGALATFLDLLFKPGIRILILGGSFEQSARMYAHLRDFFSRPEFEDLLDRPMTERTISLHNSSRVDILAQSQRSVRGWHVHKLRCDELDLFDPDVWSAAQFITRSQTLGPVHVTGSVEVFSTMHQPFGLMHDLVTHAQRTNSRALFRWNLIDVLQPCPPMRTCQTCALWPDCAGRAKLPDTAGYFSIADALTHKSRSAPRVWQSEMLCAKPLRTSSVYPSFDPALHVCDSTCPLPLPHPPHVTGGPLASTPLSPTTLAGMDFGFRAPAVFLWASYFPASDHLHIVDEHHASELTIAQHIQIIRNRNHPAPLWIGIDPAGLARHEHSGLSSATLLRKAGYRIRARRTPLSAGLDAVAARLRTADGSVRLTIHPRCIHLIDSLARYHFPASSLAPASLAVEPVKDGSDHACDALRYLITNLDAPPLSTRPIIRSYL